MGRDIDFNKHCKSQLGSYIEANEDRVVTNTHNPRKFTCIFLVPPEYIQGTLKLFDRNTGVVKSPQTMTEFPMPDRVITLLDK